MDRSDRRPRSERRPAVIAAMLAIAMLLQGLLALAHAGSHVSDAGFGPCGGKALASGGDPHRHESRPSPSKPEKTCDVCAAIASGKLGWDLPSAALVVTPSPGYQLERWTPGESPARAVPATGAPRGPPARA